MLDRDDAGGFCNVYLKNGIVFYRYSSAIDRKCISVNVPKNANVLHVGRGGVDFIYKDVYYNVRAGSVSVDGCFQKID